MGGAISTTAFVISTGERGEGGAPITGWALLSKARADVKRRWPGSGPLEKVDATTWQAQRVAGSDVDLIWVHRIVVYR